MNCAYSDNFLNLTFYLDLLLVAGSHPSKDETSLLKINLLFGKRKFNQIVPKRPTFDVKST